MARPGRCGFPRCSFSTVARASVGASPALARDEFEASAAPAASHVHWHGIAVVCVPPDATLADRPSRSSLGRQPARLLPHAEATGGPPWPGDARVTFEWLDRAWLIERWTVDMPEAPDGVAVIGPDESRQNLCQHYFDSRGVARVFGMSLKDGVWQLWRDGGTSHSASPARSARTAGRSRDAGRSRTTARPTSIRTTHLGAGATIVVCGGPARASVRAGAALGSCWSQRLLVRCACCPVRPVAVRTGLDAPGRNTRLAHGDDVRFLALRPCPQE